MSDSEDLQSAAGIVAATRRMDPNVEELLGSDQLLSGPAVVELIVEVEEALTPQEAVDFMIRRIVNAGFNTFTFAVTDKLTGDQHFVRAGELLTLAQVQAEVQTDNEDDDDEQQT